MNHDWLPKYLQQTKPHNQELSTSLFHKYEFFILQLITFYVFGDLNDGLTKLKSLQIFSLRKQSNRFFKQFVFNLVETYLMHFFFYGNLQHTRYVHIKGL